MDADKYEAGQHAAAAAHVQRLHDAGRDAMIQPYVASIDEVGERGLVFIDVRDRYGLAARIILYVGTIEPRKSLPTLLDAFAERRASGDLTHQLVCVGPYGWLSRNIAEQLERLQIAQAVRFTGYVPFEDLPAIYNLAEMFVFPSLYEGFGLPVIEAMACGTPVITGPAAALAEVADYLTINISSPNTPGLRNLQADEALTRLLAAVLKARSKA